MAKRTKKGAASPSGTEHAFREHRKRRLAHRFAELVDEAKRRRAGARKRHRVMTALAKAAGVDMAALAALHRDEWQLMLRRAERQERSARALLAREQSMRRRMLGTINRHREHAHPKKRRAAMPDRQADKQQAAPKNPEDHLADS